MALLNDLMVLRAEALRNGADHEHLLLILQHEDVATIEAAHNGLPVFQRDDKADGPMRLFDVEVRVVHEASIPRGFYDARLLQTFLFTLLEAHLRHAHPLDAEVRREELALVAQPWRYSVLLEALRQRKPSAGHASVPDDVEDNARKHFPDDFKDADRHLDDEAEGAASQADPLED